MSDVWTVRRRPGGARHHGLLQAGGRVFACSLGRCGITVTKHEGDGATPRGDLAIIDGWFRRDRRPSARRFRGFTVIRGDDGWCDDPAHGLYNRPVRLPFGASHEAMARSDRLYDVCLVLDWNVSRRARHRGSAIFLHIAPPGQGPTAGCVAVEPKVMDSLLRRLRPGTILRVIA